MGRMKELHIELMELENEVALRAEEIKKYLKDIEDSGKEVGLDSKAKLSKLYTEQYHAKSRIKFLRRVL